MRVMWGDIKLFNTLCKFCGPLEYIKIGNPQET
jgi:hypothetical protein